MSEKKEKELKQNETKKEHEKGEKETKHKERHKQKMTEVLSVLKQQLDENKAAAEEYKDLAQRIKAEFDNYKKRVLKENENLVKRANENLISDLLVIIDSFEHGLKIDEEIKDEKFKSFYNGMELIYKNLKDTLAKYGLEEIESNKVEFSPHIHEALMIEDSDEYEVDTVSEIFQKGYMLNGNLLRPAKVKVARAKQTESKDDTGEDK